MNYSFIFKIDINIINMTTINLNRNFIISDLNKINKEENDIINIESKIEIKNVINDFNNNEEQIEDIKNKRVSYNCKIIKKYITKR